MVVGNHPVDLVLVPGFVSHLEQWFDHPAVRRWTERLASFSRLILLDKRGTGCPIAPNRSATSIAGCSMCRW
jgi:hypothetical protein